jgi:hypothetical protein
MSRFRSLARLLALMLLLLAAGDLLIAGACDDGASLATTPVPALSADDCSGHHAGHTGEDCYCCSRTVRAEVAQGVTPLVDVVGQRQDDVRRLLQSPLPIPYHPPLI